MPTVFQKRFAAVRAPENLKYSVILFSWCNADVIFNTLLFVAVMGRPSGDDSTHLQLVLWSFRLKTILWNLADSPHACCLAMRLDMVRGAFPL